MRFSRPYIHNSFRAVILFSRNVERFKWGEGIVQWSAVVSGGRSRLWLADWARALIGRREGAGAKAPAISSRPTADECVSAMCLLWVAPKWCTRLITLTYIRGRVPLLDPQGPRPSRPTMTGWVYYFYSWHNICWICVIDSA